MPLGRIITNASGQPYQAYIGRTILKPLGMTATTYDIAQVPREKLALGYRWQDETWVLEPEMRDGAFGAMVALQIDVFAIEHQRLRVGAYLPRIGDKGVLRQYVAQGFALRQCRVFQDVEGWPPAEGSAVGRRSHRRTRRRRR